MVLKGLKLRIYPNKEQREFFEKQFGCGRFVYNSLLNERQEFYRKTKSLKNFKYTTEKQLKQKFVWLKDVDAVSLQQSRMDLDKAYNNFFRKIKSKQKTSLKFKSKKGTQSYRTIRIEIDSKNKKIKLPKLDWIKYSDNRTPEGKIKSATISKTKTGKYFVSLLLEINKEIVPTKISKDCRAIGLDMSLPNMFHSSENEIANYPKFYKHSEKRIKLLSKRLSRKTKGSRNREKARVKLAMTHEKVVNRRKDFQHKLSTKIVDQSDIIGVETLDLQRMAQRFGKSISEIGWANFVSMLEYKCLWKGKHLVFADKKYASSKICNSCGYKNVELTLEEREWDCPICKSHNHRDYNAALNLKDNAIVCTEEYSGSYASGDLVRQKNSVMDLTAEIVE